MEITVSKNLFSHQITNFSIGDSFFSFFFFSFLIRIKRLLHIIITISLNFLTTQCFKGSVFTVFWLP